MIILSLSLTLSASLALNAYQFLSRRQILKRAPQSTELKEFLADLMGGGLGMIAVARVNPDDILLKSPRNR